VDASSVDLPQALAPLAGIWTGFAQGRLRFHSACWDSHTVTMVAQLLEAPGSSTPSTTLLLMERVLLGCAQKEIAIDLGVSGATVNATLKNCLTRWGIDSLRRLPALLVAAARAFRTCQGPMFAGWTPTDERGLVRYTIPRPDTVLSGLLTRAEYDVARLCIEGLTYAEVARTRCVSSRTVANQLAGIRNKLGVAGRLGLLRLCFALVASDDAQPSGPITGVVPEAPGLSALRSGASRLATSFAPDRNVSLCSAGGAPQLGTHALSPRMHAHNPEEIERSTVRL
jgi:DNA-binding CsgD family transcriptional regulator